MAGNRIKGITIEIEGNTHKLSESLREVDTQLKETQAGLRAVNKQLKLDPHNVQALKDKQELLNKAITATEEKLQKEKEALNQLKAAGNENPEAIEQQERLKEEIAATTQSLNRYKKQLDEMPSSLDLFAYSSEKVAKNTKALSAAAGGLGAALLGNAVKAAMSADELNTLARNTGLTVEELQKMDYASELVDVSVDQMAGSMKKLVQQMGKGSDVFEELGVNIYDQNGNLRDATDVWYDSLEALSQVENATERDALAMELFGKSAMDLSGIIDDGGQRLKELGQEAEDAGLILSKDAVDAANRFNDAIDKLKNTASAAFFEAGAALAETLVPALEALAEKAAAVLTWFGDLDGDTQALILTILGLVAAISPVATLFSKINVIVKGLGTAFTFLSSPMGIAVLAIGALVAAGVMLYKHWDELKAYAEQLRQNLVDNFTMMKDTVVNALTTIITWAQELPAKVGNGILENVELAFSAAEQFGQGILDTIAGFFDQMKQAGSDLIGKVRDGISEAFNGITDFLSGIGADIVGGIWGGISGAIGTFTTNVRGFFSNIVDTVKSDLGIASPSKVFAYIGEMMGEGMAEGWESSISTFNPAADIMQMTGGAMMAGNSFTNNINLYGDYHERDGLNIAMSIDRWLGERI